VSQRQRVRRCLDARPQRHVSEQQRQGRERSEQSLQSNRCCSENDKKMRLAGTGIETSVCPSLLPFCRGIIVLSHTFFDACYLDGVMRAGTVCVGCVWIRAWRAPAAGHTTSRPGAPTAGNILIIIVFHITSRVYTRPTQGSEDRVCQGIQGPASGLRATSCIPFSGRVGWW
jgi:hypothetical protein